MHLVNELAFDNNSILSTSQKQALIFQCCHFLSCGREKIILESEPFVIDIRANSCKYFLENVFCVVQCEMHFITI